MLGDSEALVVDLMGRFIGGSVRGIVGVAPGVFQLFAVDLCELEVLSVQAGLMCGMWFGGGLLLCQGVCTGGYPCIEVGEGAE